MTGDEFAMGGALQSPSGDGEDAAPVRKIPYRRMMEVDIKCEPDGARYPARRATERLEDKGAFHESRTWPVRRLDSIRGYP